MRVWGEGNDEGEGARLEGGWDGAGSQFVDSETLIASSVRYGPDDSMGYEADRWNDSAWEQSLVLPIEASSKLQHKPFQEKSANEL